MRLPMSPIWFFFFFNTLSDFTSYVLGLCVWESRLSHSLIFPSPVIKPSPRAVNQFETYFSHDRSVNETTITTKKITWFIGSEFPATRSGARRVERKTWTPGTFRREANFAEHFFKIQCNFSPDRMNERRARSVRSTFISSKNPDPVGAVKTENSFYDEALRGRHTPRFSGHFRAKTHE